MPVPFVRQGYHPSDDDYYIILDVDFNASQETIATAYRNLARKFHPDKNNQDERSRREAQIIFEKIKTAYDVLGDPRKRQIYDTLGPEGIKLDGWQLERKQMTAQEIRDEFMRIQQSQADKRQALVAKPRASFTMSLDASELFRREYSSEEEDELDNESSSILENGFPVEVSSMSASMAVDNNVAINHTMALSGNLNVKNGIGDGTIATHYRYKYSPATQYDLLYQFGNGPVISTGVTHQLNDRTQVTARGFLAVSAYDYVIPSGKITLVHKIRKYLVGKISYRECGNPSVTTSLIYMNQKLMFEVTTSYKLSKLSQGASIDFGYRFNNDHSKFSVTLAANSDEGLAVDYGCETRVLEINVIGAALSFSLPAGVTLKLRFSRANQEFNVPIYLSDEVHSGPLFYGTMVPMVAYYLIDRCYLRQFKQLR